MTFTFYVCTSSFLILISVVMASGVEKRIVDKMLKPQLLIFSPDREHYDDALGPTLNNHPSKIQFLENSIMIVAAGSCANITVTFGVCVCVCFPG